MLLLKRRILFACFCHRLKGVLISLQIGLFVPAGAPSTLDWRVAHGKDFVYLHNSGEFMVPNFISFISLVSINGRAVPQDPQRCYIIFTPFQKGGLGEGVLV